MKCLSRANQANIVEAFNSTSRYLDDLLNINNIYFDQMVDGIYPTELQLNRANSSDTEAPSFLDLNLCISNGTVFTKMYDKWNNFDFDIVNFPFLDGDVPRRTSYGVYISELIWFARASSNLSDFKYRLKPLLPNFLGRAIVILNFGGPGVSLTLFCFVVYSTRRFVVCLSVCHFVFVFFNHFSIAITSHGEERANLSAFRTFVRFVLV